MADIPGAWSEDEGANSGREKKSWRIGRWSGQKEPGTSLRVWLARAALFGLLYLTNGSRAPHQDQTR